MSSLIHHTGPACLAHPLDFWLRQANRPAICIQLCFLLLEVNVIVTDTKLQEDRVERDSSRLKERGHGNLQIPSVSETAMQHLHSALGRQKDLQEQVSPRQADPTRDKYEAWLKLNTEGAKPFAYQITMRQSDVVLARQQINIKHAGGQCRPGARRPSWHSLCLGSTGS